MRTLEPAALHPEDDDDPQMARLDPGASRLKYRIERLMLTPLVRFALRVLLPFGVCFGAAGAWLAVPDNQAAVQNMIADVRLAVENRPEFQVKLMAIDGADAAVAEAIRTDLQIDFPQSSFDLDIEALQRKVIAMDAVKSARLRIRQGGVLQVDVEQRVPQVLWRSGETLNLLDAEGVYVGRAESRLAFADLPVIAGDILTPEAVAALAAVRQAERQGPEALDRLAREIPAAVALADTARRRMARVTEEALRLHASAGPIHDRLRGFERMGARRWDVVLDRDQRILLPETGAEQALEWAIAMALTPSYDLLARDITVVDLRLPRRPTVRMTDNATQEMWRIKAIEAGRE
ncbi:cell division protein FtsQ/DivIB [Maliponia aquimaris]|uniref:Cell division protein FtsQ n=1 Tax=Maliponia aquimaris TaxID=1673631 RepID=A0A238KL04_9RHOB|nr:cell division protein FtsQ/DivIB [Maliponia aquimaris]SMX43471.1 Cell division protein FtsQ [Maliponia aquimaris]